MNGTITLRNWAVAAITCLLAAACTDTDDGNCLPDGQYPMTFTAAVDGLTATRAAGKDVWTKEDQIAVSVDGGASSKTYKISDTGGAMEPATAGAPCYWQKNTGQRILAWYPAEGATSVDISNQSGGFANIDYLTADVTANFTTSAVTLPFKHQMAKVKYTLTAGEGITADMLNAATVSIYGYTQASFSKGTASGSTNGWIKPVVESTSSGEALVVPQQMQGTKFIKVTIGDKDYYYTPKGIENANLKAGNAETYTITVKQSGLSVTWQSGGQFDDTATETSIFKIHLKELNTPEHASAYRVTDADGNDLPVKDGIYELTGNEMNISLTAAENYRLKTFQTKVVAGICKQRGSYAAATRTYTYTFHDIHSDLFLDDIKAEAEEATTSLPSPNAGDYYYADGTWSSTLTKPCIGIVFKVGAGQDDQASDYNGLADNTIHGYVVALTDTHSEKCAWGGDGVLINTSTNQDDFLGYSNTQLIIKEAQEGGHLKPDNNVTDYPAAYYISQYEKTVAAPATSSGWYFPSTGQLKAIWKVRNQIESKFSDTEGSWFKTDDYLSSSEYDRGYISFNVGYVSFSSGSYGYKEKDDNPAYVRAILTF